MFGIIIRQSVPIVSICKSCNRCFYQFQNHIYLNTQFARSNKRFINNFQPLLYSQKPETKKNIELNNEINDLNSTNQNELEKEDIKEIKKYDTKTITDQQKSSQEDDDQRKKEEKTRYQKKEKDGPNPFGNDMILHTFENINNKNKDSYLECIRMYSNKPGRKRERVEFIYAALKYMEEFGVHKDLAVYKELLNIFPKEVMIPTNVFQSMFMHYPKEQHCAIVVLEQMENFAVFPDSEMELLLLNIFGQHAIVLQKYWKMMYWMPKFKNLNPWPVPDPMPDDLIELAKLALIKISSIDVTSEITTFDTKDVEDSIDKTWIVSVMSPVQSELLLKHNKKTPIYVEGPFRIYVATKSLDYFILRADPIENRKFPDEDPDDVDKIENPYLQITRDEVILPPTVHEDFDGTIFANCITGTCSKDSLLSWIRCLQKTNPVLNEIPIVFTLKNYSQEKFYLEQGGQIPDSESEKDSDNKFIR